MVGEDDTVSDQRWLVGRSDIGDHKDTYLSEIGDEEHEVASLLRPIYNFDGDEDTTDKQTEGL